MKRKKHDEPKVIQPADEEIKPIALPAAESQAEPDSTPAVLTAEAIQRQANHSRHSERTYNGGKRLS